MGRTLITIQKVVAKVLGTSEAQAFDIRKPGKSSMGRSLTVLSCGEQVDESRRVHRIASHGRRRKPHFVAGKMFGKPKRLPKDSADKRDQHCERDYWLCASAVGRFGITVRLLESIA